MKTFLAEVASVLYDNYGGDLSPLTVVFPNRRGSLFFSRELSRIITEPTWEPQYSSIDDLLRIHTGLETAHILTLTAELYKVYKKHLPETETDFDSFFSWGRLIIGDFDTIDKYLIDSRKLYSNMKDLEDLDVLLGDDFAEKELILNFWRSIKGSSKHSSTFLNIWEKLGDIYDDFTAVLKSKGIGYAGMIYRTAAEAIQEGSNVKILEGQYIFVGFNALNRCEQIILDYLQKEDRAMFFWDADRYYLVDENQEAGLFLRQNIKRFGNDYTAPRNFVKKKHISIVKSPTDVMQCKALYHYLEQLQSSQGFVDSETAIVLTDEALLPVVLYSIPENIRDINVTMGSPLTQSAPYVFFERLVSLQKNRKEGKYYYRDVLAVLAHPYISKVSGREAKKIETDINTAQYIYVPTDLLHGNDKLRRVFTTDNLNAESLSSYYMWCIETFCMSYDSDNETAVENNEYTMALLENLNRIAGIIIAAGIEVSTHTYHSLLGQMNSLTRVPFEGHPLRGLQIMGILESRCLDFKNIYVLSMCDDNFPGNRLTQSFIPPNLRRGFSLPSSSEHSAMWAYYFYRLIQRAENVTLMYSTSRDGDGASGEQSRYIYQLQYESPHEVHLAGVDLHISPSKASAPIKITKSVEILDILRNKTLSPSAINTYIDCPLRFYFHHIARIRGREEPESEISAADSGSILHLTIEKLYKSMIGRGVTSSQLKELHGNTEEINSAIDSAALKVLGGRLDSPSVQSNMEHLKRLLCNQVSNIISYDASAEDIEGINALEHPFKTSFEVDGLVVNIGGYIDRIDTLRSGVTRVVDYKSGSADLKFDGVDSLFTNLCQNCDEHKYARHNGAVLQTLIYTLGFNGSVAAVFPLKNLCSDGFSPYPFDRETGCDLREISNEFRLAFSERLTDLLREIMSARVPFEQTPFLESCRYCPYEGLCNRTPDVSSDEDTIST